MSSESQLGLEESTRDPFELNRLAEELAIREARHETNNATRHSASLDLLQLKPLSHDNNYLTASEFNVEEFLLSRSHMSLADLRAELREYLATLKEELVKLINDDYEAFISLSTDLKYEGERLEHIKAPLDGIRSVVLDSQKQLQEIQDTVKVMLERRAALREEKTLLQLLLKISDSVTRLETLLLISAPAESDSSGQIGPSSFSEKMFINDDKSTEKSKGNRSKHLLRIATEYNQLLYHVNKASSENCAFVDEIHWRIDRIKSTLSSDLEHHFATVLLSLTSPEKTSSGSGKPKQIDQDKNRLMSDLIDCLKAYDLLGLWRDAEDVISREVVRGFVKKTIFPSCLSGPHSPLVPPTPYKQDSFQSFRPPPTPYTPYTAFTSKNNHFFSNPADFDSSMYMLDEGDNPLAGLYNQILKFVSREMKSIMEAADRVGSQTSQNPVGGLDLTMNINDNSPDRGFDILSNVVWVEVSRAIIDDLGHSVFASGQPDEFRKNYETTQAFLRSFEYLAPSLRSVDRLRHHPSFEAFERRWQLPVYFQLRWKEIVGQVEEALESRSLSAGSIRITTSDVFFVMSQSNTVWTAICQCWSAEIFIPDLAPRFWRLTLQLIKRYRVWIDSCLPSLDIISKSRTPIVDKGNGPGLPTSRSSTPVPFSDAQSPDKTVEDDKMLYQCANVMQDLKEMEKVVANFWEQQIQQMLPTDLSTEDKEGQPEAVIKSSLRSMTDIIPLLSNQVESILTRRCCEALAPVKSLPGQFRATSQKHMPSKPSAFVPLILRPVKMFFGVDAGDNGAKSLRKDFCVPISSNVVDSVSSRYMNHLSAMRKTEESLRRLRMGKRTGFSLFGGSGTNADEDSRDEERVRKQLILDVEAFGKDAEALGVDLDGSPAFKALNYMVHAGPSEAEAS